MFQWKYGVHEMRLQWYLILREPCYGVSETWVVHEDMTDDNMDEAPQDDRFYFSFSLNICLQDKTFVFFLLRKEEMVVKHFSTLRGIFLQLTSYLTVEVVQQVFCYCYCYLLAASCTPQCNLIDVSLQKTVPVSINSKHLHNFKLSNKILC